jgi:hypothetical protein
MAGFGGTGFQPVHRPSKMPVPPKTYPNKPMVRGVYMLILARRAMPALIWLKVVK